MALFSTSRDASLVRSINRELLHCFISIEVEYYKIAADETEVNLYDESNKKVYYQPVRIFGLILKEDTVAVEQDIGLDFTKSTVFSFLRDDLVDNNIFVEQGDIIGFDGGYYEIDNVRKSQYWMGRNPGTLIANVQNDINEHGYSVAVNAETHKTKLSGLHLTEIRSGINTMKSKTIKIQGF